MKGREFKDLVFEQFAKIAMAFSAPKRLEIIDVLAQGERDVESLSKQVAMTVANTSRHLQVLKNARLVESRREGVRIVYRLAGPEVLAGWKTLQSLAEKRSAELKEITRLYFEERDELEPITLGELTQRAEEHGVLLLDVRPEEEYRNGHIPGAISIPLSDLKNRLDEIPRDRQVVAYCRGPYCVLSAEAMAILRNAGFRAFRLREGMPEWQQAGQPVETLTVGD
ncbi:metalloregulator ArsR/SmtB family transcription factor [candidate division KSB1 bacterium]|nr:metalloregulator ArsR/SmtB family transcription factor [Phycisphaerae bacterium]NIU08582.1 metalloregulator ArsR/SmtB family transcription factor [Phycisphaerae bacterium]NIV93979.1 metalloregulator ArsR/SmtB family transcription factor [candidate division KSB1 bacterium]NIX28917.1 metalloregulator ArsR/SmtB family transcription factor [Phycisphaerae bacterium]